MKSSSNREAVDVDDDPLMAFMTAKPADKKTPPHEEHTFKHASANFVLSGGLAPSRVSDPVTPIEEVKLNPSGAFNDLFGAVSESFMVSSSPSSPIAVSTAALRRLSIAKTPEPVSKVEEAPAPALPPRAGRPPSRASDGAGDQDAIHNYLKTLKDAANTTTITSTLPVEECDKFIDDWTNTEGTMIGEKPHLLKISDVGYCRRKVISGTLVMTPYQVYFTPIKRTKFSKRVYGANTSGVVCVPLGTIARVEVAPPTKKNAWSYLEIYCKDIRFLRFAFKEKTTCERAQLVIAKLAFPFSEQPEFLYCFAYKAALNKQLGRNMTFSPVIDGWSLYNAHAEYKRMGLPNDDLVLSELNKDYRLCSTYPAVLVLPSPKHMSTLDLEQVATFRSRSRIPALSWKHPLGKATIWRCSQPKVGQFTNRNAADEKMLITIRQLNPGMLAKKQLLPVFDARPKISAMANKMAGKGYEEANVYRQCNTRFMNIQNIHVVRDACQKIGKACQRKLGAKDFLHSVVSSGWLSHMSDLLKAVLDIVITIDRDGCSLVSHCSDGWDRTSQLTSLGMLCLDPYYRTTKGFFVLVEKEWLSFGHKFQERTGHGEKDHSNEQRAPIFLQFIDCVYQIMVQFPCHFQFNSQLLVVLVTHLHSCRFGTFLFETENDRVKMKLKDKTISVWTYLLSSPAAKAGHFTNPLYSYAGDGDMNMDDPIAPVRKAADAPPVQAEDPAHRGPPADDGKEEPHDIVGSISDVVDDEEENDQCIPSITPQISRGSVLYPTWSPKRLQVWSDYFLRWNTEETQAINHGLGTLPPFGAAITTLVTSESLFQGEICRLARELQQSKQELAAAHRKISQLESVVASHDAEEKTLEELLAPDEAAPPGAPASENQVEVEMEGTIDFDTIDEHH